MLSVIAIILLAPGTQGANRVPVSYPFKNNFWWKKRRYPYANVGTHLKCALCPYHRSSYGFQGQVKGREDWEDEPQLGLSEEILNHRRRRTPEKTEDEIREENHFALISDIAGDACANASTEVWRVYKPQEKPLMPSRMSDGWKIYRKDPRLVWEAPFELSETEARDMAIKAGEAARKHVLDQYWKLKNAGGDTSVENMRSVSYSFNWKDVVGSQAYKKYKSGEFDHEGDEKYLQNKNFIPALWDPDRRHPVEPSPSPMDRINHVKIGLTEEYLPSPNSDWFTQGFPDFMSVSAAALIGGVILTLLRCDCCKGSAVVKDELLLA